MFDVGFSELLVIGIVALLVIGPEKLPSVARTVGALLGRMQRYVNDVKADINREIELDELKKLQTTVQDAAKSIETSMTDTMSTFQAQADELNKVASGDIAGLTEVKPADPLPIDTQPVDALSAVPGTAVDAAVEPAPAQVALEPVSETGSQSGSQGSFLLEPAPTNGSGAGQLAKSPAVAS